MYDVEVCTGRTHTFNVAGLMAVLVSYQIRLSEKILVFPLIFIISGS